MSKYTMVDGSQSFARTQSGAIININKDEIDRARSNKIKRKNKDKEFRELKNEVGEIKELLNKLIEKL
tara:strand:- start:266 stop:469 length:204 start_codon:yes stop_codon:yes gene_type:complete